MMHKYAGTSEGQNFRGRAEKPVDVGTSALSLEVQKSEDINPRDLHPEAKGLPNPKGHGLLDRAYSAREALNQSSVVRTVDKFFGKDPDSIQKKWDKAQEGIADKGESSPKLALTPAVRTQYDEAVRTFNQARGAVQRAEADFVKAGKQGKRQDATELNKAKDVLKTASKDLQDLKDKYSEFKGGTVGDLARGIADAPGGALKALWERISKAWSSSAKAEKLSSDVFPQDEEFADEGFQVPKDTRSFWQRLFNRGSKSATLEPMSFSNPMYKGKEDNND